MLAQMLLTVSAKMLSCQSYILSFIFWIWRKGNKKVKPLLAEISTWKCLGYIYIRNRHRNVLQSSIFRSIWKCINETAYTFAPYFRFIETFERFNFLSRNQTDVQKKNAKIHRAECINMFASLKTKKNRVFYASLTCSLSRYSARSHAVAFEYFNNFTTKCRNVLLNLVHIILSNTLRFGLALLNCYVASHQISHYLLFGVQ